MEEQTQSVADAAEKIAGGVTHNRKRLMIFGVLSLILGIAGIFMNVAMTVTSIIMLGIFVLIAGIAFLVESFAAPEWKEKVLDLVIAIIYIAGAIVMMVNPVASAVSLTLFLGFFLIVIGILRIVMGFQLKGDTKGWGMVVFLGIINIILGVMIFNQWPESGLWVIGLFVSIELILQGIMAIMLSSEVKSVQKNIKETIKN